LYKNKNNNYCFGALGNTGMIWVEGIVLNAWEDVIEITEHLFSYSSD
jgi:hypothetical protein